MNPNIEAEIAEIKRTVEENNKLLKKIHATARWNMMLGLIKWVVYFAIIIGTYAILQPYINQMLGVYGGIQDSASTLSDIKNNAQNGTNSLLDLLK
jgi:hypothetical protein